ncbi:MAG: SMC-Scp complex subunit ScpB [Candidatus Paceibacterota bacterium]
MLSHSAALEALLFASGESLEKKRLAALLGVSESEVVVALAELVEALQGRGVTLIETETEVELRTAAEATEVIKRLRESELARDLGKASLETLAVIAYQKGATRSEVDWVRGVNSAASMRTLLLRGLVEGREDEVDKRRVRYTLTTEALAHLGVGRVEDLPRFADLATMTKEVVREETSA